MGSEVKIMTKWYEEESTGGGSGLKAEHLLTLPNEHLELLEQKVSRV